MKGKEFFGNLRTDDENNFEVATPESKIAAPKAEDVISQLGIGNDANNINVTITLNRDLFTKIEKIQKELEKKNKCKISKSKIITKICEQYLAEFSAE